MPSLKEPHGHVLLVTQRPADGDHYRASLAGHGFSCWPTDDGDDIFDVVDHKDIDVVFAEMDSRPDEQLELCRTLAARRPSTRVVLCGRDQSFDRLLAALRAGAFDYLVTPVDEELLVTTLLRAVRDKALRQENKRLRQALAETAGFEELVGSSQPMQRLFEELDQAARSGASILVTGESGVGKELVAQALHRRSARNQGPFVAVNCSALPESLLESELFGHVKGAYTDAKGSRAGLFVKAHGGTLFLDEVGDLPMTLQPKLLRALQERTVRPVGDDQETAIDVRVIAATNVNIESAIMEKTFRSDLYYRLNVIHLDVPALRNRVTDIVLLAQHFMEHFALQSDKGSMAPSPGVVERLLAYSWPGNVRELRNCIERAVAFCQGDEIQVSDLPEKVRNYRPSHVLVVSNAPAELVTLDEVERRYILRVLSAVKGNKRETARILGVDRRTLYRKLARFGVGD